MGFYESLKGYMERRKYERLDPPIRRRCRLRIGKMGGRKRRILRQKLGPRLRFMWFKPKPLVVKLRDAYVNMMMNLSSNRVFSSERVMGIHGTPFGQHHLKEYDPKMLVEMHELYLHQDRSFSPSNL